MYRPRRIERHPCDDDGLKVYTISARHAAVAQAPYREHLARVKARIGIDWTATAAFVIFHDGAERPYLVLAWWGNGNELFTSVSVGTSAGWVESPAEYSFCVHDLEVFWFERNAFVHYLDGAAPSLAGYRDARWPDGAQHALPSADTAGTAEPLQGP